MELSTELILDDYEPLNHKINTDEQYLIAENASVYNTKTKRIIGHEDKNGYVSYTVAGVFFYAHILHFLHLTGMDEIPAGYEVCHVDGKRNNNFADNLVLSTISQNRKDREMPRHGYHPHYGCKVLAVNLEKNTKPKVFENGAKASKYYNIAQGMVSAILNKKQYYNNAVSKFDDQKSYRYTFKYLIPNKLKAKDEFSYDL